MRTFKPFLTATSLTILASLPALAEPVPANPDNVTLEVSANVVITNITYPGTNAPVTNVSVAPVQVKVPPYLGMERLNILVTTNLNEAWNTNSSTATTNTPGPNNLVGLRWTNGTAANQQFVRAEITPVTDYKRRVVVALNRLAYGPTPELLKAFLGTNSDGIIGGEGATGATMDIETWIADQLNPGGVTETVSNQFPTAIISGVGGSDMFTRLGEYNAVILSNTTITNVGFTNIGVSTQLTYYTTPGETNEPGTLAFHDFRAWYAMHSVGADRQLLEVLNYFCENHFVSQWTKLRQEYQGGFNGQQSEARDRIPTKFEALETIRWRNLLVDPQCTFSNLMIKHIESESEIVYLDTNDSIGNGSNIANENYQREILELFGMGVDNGYDQGDIVAGSPAWTGWDMEKVPVAQALNLFAIAENSANDLTGGQARNRGVYARQYRYNRHGNRELRIFYTRNPGVPPTGANYPNGSTTGKKVVDSRFNGSGMTPSFNYVAKTYPNPPFVNATAGSLANFTANAPGEYALFIPAFETPVGQSNGGTNGLQAGYMIAKHLADLPYTQEFISVKLCRLFIGDDFQYGPVLGYDFSDGTVTPEEQLVWDCMMAWENNTPKGQIYKLIEVIVNSDLFKNSYGQKVKTPYEFTVSAVRALRYPTNGLLGPLNYTATTDGYSMVSGNASRGGTGGIDVTNGPGNWHNGSTQTGHPLNRLGRYLLFDREEPDGYPETGTVYVGAGGLVERGRWLAMILDDPNASGATTSDGVSGGNYTRTDPVGLIKQFNSTTAKLRDPDFVARFFLAILFPGEGQGVLDEYRRLAVDVLLTNQGGDYPIALPATTTQDYDRRVRRMVAMLMQMPQFNEQ